MPGISNLLDVETVFRLGIGAAITIGTGAGVYFLFKKIKKEKHKILTKGERDNPYESIQLLNEYLAFNYGGPRVNCLFGGPQDGFDFPKQTAEICMKYYQPHVSIPNRALDVGCAVGRASFELSQQFDEVIGIDYSQGFVKTCNALKQSGNMEFDVKTEGMLTTKHQAIVPTKLKRENCKFLQGDACSLAHNLGKFGCVLAANLICRLPRPKEFLIRLSSLVAPGGICVLTSPYTFLEDYTIKENWLGGYLDSDGNEVRAIDTLKKLLEPHFTLIDELDVPFLIRETARKHQYTISHATIWKRKA